MTLPCVNTQRLFCRPYAVQGIPSITLAIRYIFRACSAIEYMSAHEVSAPSFFEPLSYKHSSPCLISTSCRIQSADAAELELSCPLEPGGHGQIPLFREVEPGCARRYVLANIETKGGVRRGDRVWQIAFGSGFKCNSAIWRALRHVNTQHAVWT